MSELKTVKTIGAKGEIKQREADKFNPHADSLFVVYWGDEQIGTAKTLSEAENIVKSHILKLRAKFEVSRSPGPK